MPARSPGDVLDAALTRRVEAQARVTDALIALESHPGHRLLATAALTGVTAQRWAATQELLASVHADLAAHRVVVADACAVRTRRQRPGAREWVQLRALLLTPNPDELINRIEGRLSEISDVLEAAEAVHLAALAGLGPVAERVRDARVRAHDLLAPDDPDVAALATLTDAVDARLATCTNDPLSLSARLPRDLVDGLVDGSAGDLDRIEERLAELAAARDGWADRRGAAADAIAALGPLRERADRACREALDRVADTVAAAPGDPRPALRHRLAALPAHRPGADALAALPRLVRDVEAAADALLAAEAGATAFTDRRAELVGRFAAYRAKALRLGASDDPQVVDLTAQIRGLLGARRTDLPALTRALHAYQDRVNGVGRRSA